jgi:hypothetical protein
MKTYVIIGEGLPANIDRDGWDTREAAESAIEYLDGNFRVEAKEVARYVIMASTYISGMPRESQNTVEFLGGAYGQIYKNRWAADFMVKQLQSSVEEMGLDPSTMYEVIEI